MSLHLNKPIQIVIHKYYFSLWLLIDPAGKYSIIFAAKIIIYS